MRSRTKSDVHACKGSMLNLLLLCSTDRSEIRHYEWVEVNSCLNSRCSHENVTAWSNKTVGVRCTNLSGYKDTVDA